jgi:hypothetical protein
MLKQYEELAVLDQGDDGAIVSVRGQGGPSVLLNSAYVGHLEMLLERASIELRECCGSGAAATRTLCAEIQTLIATYQEMCCKFEGGPPARKSIAKALEELAEMRSRLNAL